MSVSVCDMICRYSDRVKEETERFNQLELDDLEVN